MTAPDFLWATVRVIRAARPGWARPALSHVLEVYAKPRDAKRPLVCLDEFCKQLIGDAREVVPAQPGQPERQDYKYIRHGMCRMFMAYSPLESWREVRVTGQRPARDYAHTIRWLCNEVYPRADKMVLVQDNLNTHTPVSLYEAFALLKPFDSKSALNGIIPPNTAVGSIWRRWRTASPRGNVCPGDPMKRLGWSAD